MGIPILSANNVLTQVAIGDMLNPVGCRIHLSLENAGLPPGFFFLISEHFKERIRPYEARKAYLH